MWAIPGFFSYIVFSAGMAVTPVHPLHVSVTEIEFDEKDKALEIIMRIFIDDLEEAIRIHQQDKTLNILEPRQKTSDQLVNEYLAKHFRIFLDGKQQKTIYLGHELEGDAIICYIEVANVRKWKVIEIINDIIFEVYDDQSNIINVTVRDDVKSLRLTTHSSSGKIAFDNN